MKNLALREVVLGSLILLLLATGSTLAVSSVDYTLSLAHRDESLLEVRMKVSGATGKSLEVALPTWDNTYMIRDFARFIERIQAVDAQDHPLPLGRIAKSSWRLTLQGNSEVEIRYSIRAVLPGTFSAELNSDHAFIHAGLVCLFLPQHRQVRHRIHFEDRPSGWRIATGLEEEKPGVYRADDYDHLVDSPFEISAFESKSFDWKGVRYQVVVDGREESFPLGDLVRVLEKIVAYEVELMGNPPFHRYVFIYHISEGGSGGMEHRNSTAIGLRRSAMEEGVEAAASVSAHEFFHLWNVKRIRPVEFDHMNWLKETPTRALWFSEGGTSYYALLTLIRSGIIDEARFYRQLGREIRSLQSRPARLFQSAERSSLETWFDRYPEYHRPENSISYYNKGLLISLLLDLEIRHRTQDRHSLDDVLRWMNVWFGDRNVGFQPGDIQRAAESVSQSNFDDFFQRYVSGVEELPYSSILGYAGMELVKGAEGELEVQPAANPTPIQRAIRTSLMRGTTEAP